MSPFQTAADIVLHVRSENSSSERRVNPSWSIAAFKTRLEPITGIPSSAQRLRLKLPGAQPSTPIEGADEESTQLSSFAFQTYAEIIVGLFLFHLVGPIIISDRFYNARDMQFRVSVPI